EVEVYREHIGAGEVVDGDKISAAEGDDIDLLGAVDVHGHAADIAGEPHAAAIGGNIKFFRDIGAIELQGIETTLPFHDVAGFAGVPDKRVIAIAHERGIESGSADDRVIALAAGEEIVAGAAVDGQAAGARNQAGGIHDVSAA